VIVRIANLAKRSAFMNQEKYIDMDVHQATISVAVMDVKCPRLLYQFQCESSID
jgi:hypothetical protein